MDSASRAFAKDSARCWGVNRMMRIPLFLLAVALATMPATAHCAVMQSEMLFKHEQLLIDNSENNLIATQFDLDIVFLDNELFPNNLMRLFDDAEISTTGGETVFESTAANNPNFADAVALLTDTNYGEFIRITLAEKEGNGLTATRGWMESIFFLNGNFPNPNLFTQSQLANATIDRFKLEVKEFSLSPTGSAGPTAPIHLLAEFSVYGTLNTEPIPEPSAGWLFLCGLAILSLLLPHRPRRPQLANSAISQ